MTDTIGVLVRLDLSFIIRFAWTLIWIGGAGFCFAQSQSPTQVQRPSVEQMLQLTAGLPRAPQNAGSAAPSGAAQNAPAPAAAPAAQSNAPAAQAQTQAPSGDQSAAVSEESVPSSEVSVEANRRLNESLSSIPHPNPTRTTRYRNGTALTGEEDPTADPNAMTEARRTQINSKVDEFNSENGGTPEASATGSAGSDPCRVAGSINDRYRCGASRATTQAAEAIHALTETTQTNMIHAQGERAQQMSTADGRTSTTLRAASSLVRTAEGAAFTMGGVQTTIGMIAFLQARQQSRDAEEIEDQTRRRNVRVTSQTQTETRIRGEGDEATAHVYHRDTYTATGNTEAAQSILGHNDINQERDADRIVERVGNQAAEEKRTFAGQLNAIGIQNTLNAAGQYMQAGMLHASADNYDHAAQQLDTIATPTPSASGVESGIVSTAQNGGPTGGGDQAAQGGRGPASGIFGSGQSTANADAATSAQPNPNASGALGTMPGPAGEVVAQPSPSGSPFLTLHGSRGLADIAAGSSTGGGSPDQGGGGGFGGGGMGMPGGMPPGGGMMGGGPLPPLPGNGMGDPNQPLGGAPPAQGGADAATAGGAYARSNGGEASHENARSGGGSEMQSLLDRVLGKKDDENGKGSGGILRFGARAPADLQGSRPGERWSPLDRNVNLFERLHGSYQDYSRRGLVSLP